jgi:hypothetical protein
LLHFCSLCWSWCGVFFQGFLCREPATKYKTHQSAKFFGAFVPATFSFLNNFTLV